MIKFNKATKLFVSAMMVVSTLSVPIYSLRVVHAEDETINSEESVRTKTMTFHIVDRDGNYVSGVHYEFSGSDHTSNGPVYYTFEGETTDGPLVIENMNYAYYSVRLTPPEDSELTNDAVSFTVDNFSRDEYYFSLLEGYGGGIARLHLYQSKLIGFDSDFEYEQVPLINQNYQICNSNGFAFAMGTTDDNGDLVSNVILYGKYYVQVGNLKSKSFYIDRTDVYNDIDVSSNNFDAYYLQIFDPLTNNNISKNYERQYELVTVKDILNENGDIIINKGQIITSGLMFISDLCFGPMTFPMEYVKDGYFAIKKVDSSTVEDDSIILLDSNSRTIKKVLYKSKVQLNAKDNNNQVVQNVIYTLTKLDENGNKTNVYYEGKDQDVLKGFEPGTYLLEASAEGYKSISREVEIKDSSDVQVIDVMLEKNEVVKPDQPSTDDKDNTGTTTKPDIPSTDDKTDTPSTSTTNVEVKTEGNVPTVSLDTNKEELVKTLVKSGALTKEEQEAITNGAKLDVVLEVKDGTNTISQESKQQILENTKDYTVAKYLDISLVRYLTVNGVQDEGKEVHEMTNKIKVGITIPEELLNVPEGMTRTYYLVRNHNGKVEILVGTFDANTKVSVFETDQFSDYALAYKDEKIKTNTETTPVKKEETGTKDTTKKTTTTVNTSDNTNVLMYVALTLVAMLGIAVTVRRKVSR